MYPEESPAAFAEESVTVNNSSTSLTAATHSPSSGVAARRAFITVETAQIRYWYSGTDPDASTGHLANPGDIITLEGVGNIANFRAIRTGATSAVLRATYER